MTKKNPKRPPGSYRAPSTNGSKEAAATRPRGLSGMFAPRPTAPTSMPKIPSSLMRGFVAVLAAPILIIAVPVLVIVEWLLAVALGFQGPFSVFVNALAIPPVGTIFDASVATGIWGGQAGFVFVIGFVAVRGVIMAVATVAIVQMLERNLVETSALSRGVRILPVTLAVGFMNMAIVTLSGVFLQLGGIGLLLQIGGMVVGLYLFVFAPVIAAVEGRGMSESLSRGIRAARMPGTGNLLMASLYLIPSLALLLSPGKPGSLLGVNPTVGAWILVLVANVAHLGFLGTFAFRYLCIADEVPDPPPRRARAARR
jgi:hypothetical protein